MYIILASDFAHKLDFRLAFDKWKVVKKRHQEDMSLLRSFQDVKREGNATPSDDIEILF